MRGAARKAPGPTRPPSDAEHQLLALAAGGNKAALFQVLRDWAELPWGVARSFGLSRQDAQFVVDVTWLRFVDRLNLFVAGTGVARWLVATAYRESLRAIRVAGSGDGPVRLADRQLQALAPVEGRCRGVNLVVYGVYERLRSRRRILLRLLADGRLKYREISDATGIPVGSIGPTRNRIMLELGRDIAQSRTLPQEIFSNARRAFASCDPPPEEFDGEAGTYLAERRPAARLAELAFDSLIDRGTPPDFGDRPGTRILVFRGPGVSMVLRTRESEGSTTVKGVLIPPQAGTVAIREEGHSEAMALLPGDGEALYCEIRTKGPVRGEISRSGEVVVITDWVILGGRVDALCGAMGASASPRPVRPQLRSR